MNLNFLKNPRGLEVAFNTILGIIVMLIVLTVIITFFLGTIETTLTPIGGIIADTGETLQKATGG